MLICFAMIINISKKYDIYIYQLLYPSDGLFHRMQLLCLLQQESMVLWRINMLSAIPARAFDVSDLGSEIRNLKSEISEIAMTVSVAIHAI